MEVPIRRVRTGKRGDDPFDGVVGDPGDPVDVDCVVVGAALVGDCVVVGDPDDSVDVGCAAVGSVLVADCVVVCVAVVGDCVVVVCVVVVGDCVVVVVCDVVVGDCVVVVCDVVVGVGVVVVVSAPMLLLARVATSRDTRKKQVLA